MSYPFNMCTIISMYTEIFFYSRATRICWMENNLLEQHDDHLLKFLVCLFFYLESYQVVESVQKE